VEESLSRFLAISPNPSTGKFIIDVPNDIPPYGVTISDFSGRAIYTTAGKGQTQVDLSFVQKGIYLIVIDVDGKRETRKIVLK
jgi:hypothetical protein